MERVAFLIEETNQRISCLLNPESLVMRRVAGVRPRRSLGGFVTGAGLSDDPLLYTGGGQTELELALLFDTHLNGPATETEDVRELTAPFWMLAENRAEQEGYRQPPLVRFIWGKAWNILGVVTAVAEHLEDFSTIGCPQRSWMSMRLLRVHDTIPTPPPLPDAIEQAATAPEQPPEQNLTAETIEEVALVNSDQTKTHEVKVGERLDDIADQYYGSSFFWRVIAIANNIDDPADIPAGTLLRIPPIRNGKKRGDGS